MKLRDMFYLRFGLFMERQYGRAMAYIVELLIVAFLACVALTMIYGGIKLLWEIYQVTEQAQEQVKEAESETAEYRNALLTCLNGGVVGHTDDGESIGCEGSFTFKVGSKK